MSRDLKNREPQMVTPGLEGVIVGETDICSIDGKNGRLFYRGYPIETLAATKTFEEVSYLVLWGNLPDRNELTAWQDELKSWREVPPEAIAVLDKLPRDAHPLALFRTALTIAACSMPDSGDHTPAAQRRRPARLLTWSSTLAAASIRHLQNKAPLTTRHDLGFSDHFLWLSLGREPDPLESKAFDVSLVVQAEHEMHAAAFAALVVASSGADLGGAVLAGMGALSGNRHGGANQTAFQNLLKHKNSTQVAGWVKRKIEEKYRFPGFGHRIYKCPDPRRKLLDPYARELLVKSGERTIWEIYEETRSVIESELGKKGIYANVDSATGLIYHALGLPPESFPIPFCLAIQTGWMAHCLEYMPAGKMIEPSSIYICNE